MAEQTGSSTDRDRSDQGILDEPYSAGDELRKKGRESPFRAVLHVAIVLVLCVVGAAIYWSYVQDSKKITELVKEARDLQKADDYASLLKARAKFMDAIAIREDARAIGGVAAVDTSLLELHGIEKAGDIDVKAEAQKYTALATELDVPTGDRFAAEAYLMIYQGKPDEAEKYLRGVLERGAADPRLLDAVGLALMVQGKTRDAREAFRKAIDLSAGAPRYAAAMGDAYFRDGEYANAWTFYNRAAVANAEHAKGRIGKLLAKAKQGGKLKVFAEQLQQVLDEPAERLSPKDRNFAEYAAAEVALGRGRRDEAQKFVDTALARDKNDARLHYLKGRILAEESKVDEALRDFDEAIKLDPYTAAYYFDIAEILRDAGRPSEAVDRIRLYGQKNYQSDEYKLKLGMALVDKGDLAEAEDIFKKMVEADEYDADALFGLGYVFEAQKKWEPAREAYGTADQRRQGWGDPWLRMGHVALGEGDAGTAREYFDEAIKRYEKTGASRKARAKAWIGVAMTWEKEGKAKPAAKARDTAEKLLK
ncbi:MAG: tetratricopeptide repeat protein [Pseudomonadota bacterium]